MSNIPKTVYLFILLFLLSALVTCAFSAVSTSTSYQMATQVIDGGGERGASASYSMIGKTRDLEIGIPSSANFTIASGFLKTAYNSAPIFSPVPTSVDPSTVSNEKAVTITVNGANFASGAQVKLSKAGALDIFATGVTFVSPTKLECNFDMTGADTGLWNITVINPDSRSGSLPSALTVKYAAPKIDSVYPRKGVNNSFAAVELTGRNFRAGATVRFVKAGQADIIATDVSVESGSKITFKVDLRRMLVGLWDIVVTNPDTQTDTLLSAFEIEGAEIEVVGPVLSYPSPFSPLTGPTKITYTLSKNADIFIYIYNMRGERIWAWSATAGTDGGRTGMNEVAWDGLTAFREIASNGVYLVHIMASMNGQMITLSKGKMMVLK